MTNTADANLQRLEQIAREHFNVYLSEQQLEQFRQYLHAITISKHNLTSIKDPTEIVIKHFADSLSVLHVLDLEPEQPTTLIDVGTGGGFPGIPLAIVEPNLHVTLLDSTTKKITFLKELTTALGLTNVSFLDERIEAAGQSAVYRQKFDRVTARAVAWMPVLAEYMLPLCRVGGLCIAMKGENAIEETEEGRCAIKRLGGRVVETEQVELPGIASTHYLVKIAKVRPTPSSYPRRIGVPKKEPILCSK